MGKRSYPKMSYGSEVAGRFHLREPSFPPIYIVSQCGHHYYLSPPTGSYVSPLPASPSSVFPQSPPSPTDREKALPVNDHFFFYFHIRRESHACVIPGCCPLWSCRKEEARREQGARPVCSRKPPAQYSTALLPVRRRR